MRAGCISVGEVGENNTFSGGARSVHRDLGSSLQEFFNGISTGEIYQVRFS